MRLAAVTVLLAATTAHAQFVRPCTVWPFKLLPWCQTPTFTLDHEYDFGATAGNAPALPTFASDSDLVLKGQLAADGGWEWYSSDTPTVAGTPAQNGATFVSTTPWGYGAVTNISDSTAPVTTGWTAPAGFWRGDMTLILMGYPTTAFSATETLFTARASGNSGIGLRARFNSGNLQCFWYDTSATATVAGWNNGWSAGACHRAAAGNHFAWAGVDGSPASPSTAFTTETTTSLWIGRDDGASAGAASGGPVAWALLYKVNKTSAQISSVIRRATGVPTDTAVTISGTPVGCYEVDGGLAWCTNGLNFVGPLGYRAQKGESAQSKAAADPLDMSSLNRTAMDVVTNQSPGPLFEWKHANEGDIMLALDGGIARAETVNSFVRAPSAYSTSWYVSAGDSGTQRTQVELVLISDGGVWSEDGGSRIYCDWNDLTGVPVLKTCSGHLTSGSVVTSQLRINDAGQTGSVVAYHVRNNSSWYPELMQTSNGAVTNSDAEFDAGSDGNHSHVKGGKVEVCFAQTGANDSHTPAWDTTNPLYLHDAVLAGGGHLATYLFGYTVDGRFLYVTSTAAGDETDTTLDGISLTHEQVYCASVEWVPSGAVVPDGGTEALCNTVARFDAWTGPVVLSAFHATTSRASAHDAHCPSEWAMTHIPERYDHTVPVSANILSYREFYVP